MKKLRTILLVLAAASAAAGVLGAEGESWQKVHPRIVQDGAGGGGVEFLVVLEEQADLSSAVGLSGKLARGERVHELLTEVASRTQAPLLIWLAERDVPHRPFWIANMIWVRADLEVASTLASRAEVRRLDANPIVHSAPSPSAAAAPAPAAVEWNVEQVHADDLWALGYTGQGVVVAGHDTGYEWDHPAIKNQYRGWNGSSASHDYNWHDAIHAGNTECGFDSPEPCDDIDHGTHTMGIMVGDDGDANRIGMAPDARWIGCRNMRIGDGSPASYSECFEFFLAPTDIDGNNADPSMAPHVINNSWTCPESEGCSFDTLQTVVSNTLAAGIVVVGAATNLGGECSTIDQPPAIYDGVLTVGATDSSDDIWSGSARGPVIVDGSGRLKPDVTAPGKTIRSCIRDGEYGSFSGTSMSAPHVVGLVALLLDARPDLQGDVETIAEIVTTSALPLTSDQDCGAFPGSAVPNAVYGHGRIDALQMLFGDADADGTDNLADCSPADGAVWVPTGPPSGLTFAKSLSTELTWSAPGTVGAGPTTYDILRSDVADDFSAPVCIESDTPQMMATDDAVPDSVFYYLVRARNGCGDATAAASNETPRETGPCSE